MAVAHDLTALAERVAPVVLAHGRTLAVPDMLVGLFPDGGLVRGRVLACDGPASTSLALTLAAPTVAAGSWLATIDIPTLGLDAAAELGVPLERIVGVHSGAGPERTARWPALLAATLDGIDVVITTVPPDLTAAVARALAARIRQRGAVVLVVGAPDALACDGVLRADSPEWCGLGDGFGHLRRRRVTVSASGRRLPGHRSCRGTLPG